jgi:hypothetical protein
MVTIPYSEKQGGSMVCLQKKWPQGYSIWQDSKEEQLLRNNNWIRNLQDITYASHLDEFTLLFMALDDTRLSDHKDEIKWNKTEDGKFSISSSY